MAKIIELRYFRDKNGKIIAPFSPEAAIYDENGKRLSDKLKGIDFTKVQEAQENAIASIEGASSGIYTNTGISEYPDFSPSKSYEVGDIVKYNGILKEFTAAHPAGPWIGSDTKDTSIKKKADEKFTELSKKSLADSLSEYLNKYPGTIKKDISSPQIVNFLKLPLNTDEVFVEVKSLLSGGSIQCFVRAYKNAISVKDFGVQSFLNTELNETFSFKFVNIQSQLKDIEYDEIKCSLLIGTTFFGEFEVTDYRFLSLSSVPNLVSLEISKINETVENNKENTEKEILAISEKNKYPIDSIDIWNNLYPDGFGRESDSDEAVAANIDLYAFCKKLRFTVFKINEKVNINIRLSARKVNAEGATQLTQFQIYDNAFSEGAYVKEIDVKKLVDSASISYSDIASFELRFMQNTANFYGKFTLKELKYVDVESIYEGKQDKIPGKSLSTYDFSKYYKDKLESLENYDDTELKERIAKLEELGLSPEEIELAIKQYLDDHPELITSIQDGSITWRKFSDETKKQIRNNVINVQDYGVKGDGITDNYETLKSIFENLKEGDTVYFPHGKYIVDFQGDIPITEEDCQASDYRNIKRDVNCMTINVPNVVVEGNNSTIKVAKTMFWEYNVFNVTKEGKNFLIKGFDLEGDYKEHVDTKFYYNDTDYYSQEFGYGLYIKGNGCIKDCNIYMMMGDGIVTKNSSDYNDLVGSGSGGEIIAENCHIYYCRRQGISILDCDYITVKDCHIHDIGSLPQFGLVGKSPLGGIDIEPASGTVYVKGLTILNSRIRNCGKSIIHGNNNPEKPLIGYINIYNSEIGLTSVAREIYAINTNFIVDSDNAQFYIHKDSTLIGCHLINELNEERLVQVPKMIKSTIINRTGKYPKLSFPAGLQDCYVYRFNLSHESTKAPVFGTTLDNCKLEHYSDSEKVEFNGCTIKDLIPTSYTVNEKEYSFTANGIAYNKCLIVNEPIYENGTPEYLDTTKIESAS